MAPLMRRNTFKELGEVTAQAEPLAGQRLSMSPDELLQRAQAERAQLEAAGVHDGVEDRQPENSPPLNQSLAGRKLGVCWRYWRKALPGEKGKKKQVLIWCEGTVVEVADGTVKKSPQSKSAPPPGIDAESNLAPRDHVDTCPHT